jgi:hypothetical protein
MAAVTGLAPADATVTFVQAGTYSQTRVGSGTPDEIRTGPSDVSSDFGDGYFSSTSDSRGDYSFAQARSSAAGAVRLDNPEGGDFFVRAQSLADALANQPATHGAAGGSAIYYFSVDTDSTLSFTGFASPASTNPFATVTIDLFRLGMPGVPGAIFRQGVFEGSGTFSYALAAGTYGFEVGAYTDVRTIANDPVGHRILTSTVANVSLSILSPPVAAVPEPETWAMMVAGFAMIGAAARSRRWVPRTVAG